jgi:hypothetical protein
MKKAAITLLYLLYLIQSGLGQEVSFSGHFLYQSQSSKVFAVSTGDLDILGNNFMATGGLLWYEQTAPSAFTEHLVPFPWAHGGATGDIDSDGDIDLAAAACGSSFAWFENDGTGTSISEPDGNLPVNLQRDPFTGDIIILTENNKSNLYEVQLIDIIGRICFSTTSGTFPINIRTTQFQPGIYLLRVWSSGKQYVVKLYIENDQSK